MGDITYILYCVKVILERMRDTNPTFYKTTWNARTEKLMIKAIKDFLNWEAKNNNGR